MDRGTTPTPVQPPHRHACPPVVAPVRVCHVVKAQISKNEIARLNQDIYCIKLPRYCLLLQYLVPAAGQHQRRGHTPKNAQCRPPLVPSKRSRCGCCIIEIDPRVR
eukprot:COSAG02_NODE_1283_length_13471_cov_12.121223_12_plen_106_part_00